MLQTVLPLLGYQMQFTAEFSEAAATRGSLAAPVHVTADTMAQLACTQQKTSNKQ